MTKPLIAVGLVVAGILVGSLFTAVRGDSFGGVYSKVNKYFAEGITVGSSDQFVVETDGDVTTEGDVTISGGSLSVPTAASATSTLTVGCVQTYATSSATSIKLIFNTIATTTGDGHTLWAYGTCP